MGSVLRGLGLLLLFALVLEATARLEDWVRYRTPFFSRFRDQGELMVRDVDGAHGRPGARYQKWVMNELGMRGPEAARRKAPGVVRIVTAGASETFGQYESPGREFPRQLEDTLAAWSATRPACGARGAARFQVLNAAFPGMSLPTVEQDVRLRLSKLDPDIVALYPTPAQYLEEHPPGPARPDSSGVQRELPWMRALQPRVADRLREQIKALLPEAVKTWLRERETAARIAAHGGGWRFEAPPLDRLALFEQDLRKFVGAVRTIGAEPVLVLQANAFGSRSSDTEALQILWEKFYPRASGETIVAFDSLARGVIAKVAADSGVVAVDAARHVVDRRFFHDFSHFTDEGAGRVAAVAGAGILRAVNSRVGCAPNGQPREARKVDAAQGMARSTAPLR